MFASLLQESPPQNNSHEAFLNLGQESLALPKSTEPYISINVVDIPEKLSFNEQMSAILSYELISHMSSRNFDNMFIYLLFDSEKT
eukprot:GAHX01002620.1.p1 GENE.GAHX01002620.1~~GAHX01002620.1.p1  ORF type:complete len:86 (+),score=12.92 GAHX01002620.1:168-425(+)